MTRTLKFVVLKGVQGFGDRLQCLLQAIRYAKVTRRYLVVDWRDPDWTHDPKLPIHTFFTFSDVPSFGLQEFQAYWNTHAHNLTVFPRPWESVLLDSSYPSWIYKNIFWLPNDNDCLNDITTYKMADFEEDIVVYAGVGKRTFAYSDLECLSLSNWVTSAIYAFAKEYQLLSGSYDIVHLRGGSKSWCGGKVPLRSLKDKLDQSWPSQEEYLDSLWDAYQSSVDSLPDCPLFLIGDRGMLLQAWIERYSKGVIIPGTCHDLLRESGIHKLRPEDLAKSGRRITKDELTLESLRDFVIMLHARKVVGDGVSVFSRMGERCGAAGVRLMQFPSSH